MAVRMPSAINRSDLANSKCCRSLALDHNHLAKPVVERDLRVLQRCSVLGASGCDQAHQEAYLRLNVIRDMTCVCPGSRCFGTAGKSLCR